MPVFASYIQPFIKCLEGTKHDLYNRRVRNASLNLKFSTCSTSTHTVLSWIVTLKLRNSTAESGTTSKMTADDSGVAPVRECDEFTTTVGLNQEESPR